MFPGLGDIVYLNVPPNDWQFFRVKEDERVLRLHVKPREGKVIPFSADQVFSSGRQVFETSDGLVVLLVGERNCWKARKVEGETSVMESVELPYLPDIKTSFVLMSPSGKAFSRSFETLWSSFLVKSGDQLTDIKSWKAFEHGNVVFNNETPEWAVNRVPESIEFTLVSSAPKSEKVRVYSHGRFFDVDAKWSGSTFGCSARHFFSRDYESLPELPDDEDLHFTMPTPTQSQSTTNVPWIPELDLNDLGPAEGEFNPELLGDF